MAGCTGTAPDAGSGIVGPADTAGFAGLSVRTLRFSTRSCLWATHWLCEERGAKRSVPVCRLQRVDQLLLPLRGSACAQRACLEGYSGSLVDNGLSG